MDLYNDILGIVEREIENIVRIGALDQNSLCNLDKLIDISKDIETIKAMKESGYSGNNYDDGYTTRGYRNIREGSYNRVNDYNSRYNSNATNGMNDNRYSMHGDKKHMLDLMYEAMDMASSNDEREEIHKMIQKIEHK